jgi:hypothetical protein
MQQLIGAKTFLNKLTGGQLSIRQINRATAYLRANKVVFYDTWGVGEHCLILNDAQKNKPIVITALKTALQ